MMLTTEKPNLQPLKPGPRSVQAALNYTVDNGVPPDYYGGPRGF
jgi:hypothetical protein